MESKSSIRSSLTHQSIKRILLDGLYGLINGVLVIPVSISFTAIIFRHDYYQFALPTLIKLVMFSSMIHQLSFTCLSTLPYSIGQVQDAGLIFLSAMSASIATQLAETPDSILPTCLFAISIYTAALGFVLICLGRFRMASIVQYIPMPVIGGYLAFIGFFCAEAGLSIMAGVSVGSLNDVPLLFTVPRLIHILPGVVCGSMLFVLLPLLKSPAVLPLFLITMLSVFYLILALKGTSLEEARRNEWVSALSPIAPWYDIWKYFSFEKVCWSCIPSQITRWLTMTIVVGFSSCLDVAAIEMEASTPLDYNKELQVVGWSNVCSGLSGGFTGSYIFTQTIFSLRRGVKTRACGFVTALCELIVVLLPTPLTCYVPKFLFGSLLILIALDLVIHWLILSRNKMTLLEYLVCLSTFLAILNLGVQRGLFTGLVLAVFVFVFRYSSAPTVSISSLQQSKVARSYQDRCYLVGQKGTIVRVQPQGFVFFGTAIRLLDEVKKHILAPEDDILVHDTTTIASASTRLPLIRDVYGSAGSSDVGSTKQHSEHSPLLESKDNVAIDLIADERNPVSTSTRSSSQRVEFAVLDFSQVLGVDATAAHSCFLLLTKLLKTANVVPVYTQLSNEVERLLRAQGVIDEDCVYIPNVDDALEWCEDCLLDR